MMSKFSIESYSKSLHCDIYRVFQHIKASEINPILKVADRLGLQGQFWYPSVRIYCPDRFQTSFRAKNVCDRVHWVNNCDVKKDFQSLTISSHKTTNSSKWVLLLIQCQLTHLLQIFWIKLGSIRCKYNVRNKLVGCSGQLTFFPMKRQQALFETSSATYQLMEPHNTT